MKRLRNRTLRIHKLLALMILVLHGPAEAQQTHQKSSGPCSPPINGNSGVINVNCVIGAENTDSDPRRSLAKMGVSWTDDAFGEALLRGDVPVLKLFLAGGMKPYGKNRDNPVLVRFMLGARDIDNFEVVLQLLVSYGLDIDHVLKAQGLERSRTLASHVVDSKSVQAFRVVWGLSKKQADIRSMLEHRVAQAQKDQRARTNRFSEEDEKTLLLMLEIAAPDRAFILKGYKVTHETGASGRASPKFRTYAGADGWFLLLDTTSLVKSVSYKIGGKRRTAERTTRLPVERDDFRNPVTPVQIEVLDVRDRKLGPLTISVDVEDMR
jgi:hypothetical protein